MNNIISCDKRKTMSLDVVAQKCLLKQNTAGLLI